ncbi:peroxiredoxin family protein [Arthrospiribacter ruber]|uniref:TlpA family protein disulfide reductase n=1 Tax=Arthrospiribacter ruber TaxID=2487934 RepID=A0A951J103_9BACT|nr:TlpA disulfide reductase family protein [Arthrospiribacter ruber]MBW3468888.1 TlpA family protein disulfide reductase [Arthrospiribacter ruber]
MKNHLLLVFCMLLLACSKEEKKKSVLQEKHLVKLDISPDEIPFELVFKKSGEKWFAEIYNAEEVLEYDEVTVSDDSVKITLGIFDADLLAAITEDGYLQGAFVKNHLPDYSVPLSSTRPTGKRFPVSVKPEVDFSGRWKVDFRNGDNSYEAIGVFEQIEDKIKGTFLTKLGDYRYLEGNVSGRKFSLSAFDGSHAYLFTGELEENGKMTGEFRSGPNYRESFSAERNETFELPDAYSLSYLKDGYDKLDFSFPDLEGNPVSLSDPKYKDKVVLVQLFGTWCPNCMDETRFLGPWYDRNKDRGVEIIGLAFEYKPDFEYASSRVKKSKQKLNANYTFLVAGESNKEKASQALPALNQVVAFPTLIYIDKKGKVRHIHTGFNGPGTGSHYEKWVEDHNKLVNELLKE